MFVLSSPSPPRKAVEYLEVPACDVAVSKSRQTKPLKQNRLSLHPFPT